MASVSGLALLLLAGVGCEEEPAPRFLIVEIERADGSDPIADGSASRVRIVVRQIPLDGEPGEPMELVDDDPADGFDLRLPIDDVDATIRAHVEIETTAGTTLLGAAAPFRPVETLGAVRILVVAAGGCDVVTDAYDAPRRARPAFAAIGTFAFVAGGTTDDDAPSGQAEFIDLLAYAGGPLEPLDPAIGEARVLALDLAHVVLLPPASAPLVYDVRDGALDDGLPAAIPVTLHDGAAEAGLAALPSGGGVVAGGATGAALDTLSGDVTWLAADGAVTARTRLAVPRRAPAVHALDDTRVLVVGGAAAGPLAEIVTPDGPGTAATDAAVPADPRVHGALFPDSERPRAPGAASTRVLFAAGFDPAAASPAPFVQATTVLDCATPPACTVAAGPDLSAPAPGIAHVIPRVGGALVQDDGEVVYFGWTGGTPSFSPAATLPTPSRASAIALDAGVLLVLGAGPLQMCVPPALPLP